MSKKAVVLKENPALEPQIEAALHKLYSPASTNDKLFQPVFNMKQVEEFSGARKYRKVSYTVAKNSLITGIGLTFLTFVSFIATGGTFPKEILMVLIFGGISTSPVSLVAAVAGEKLTRRMRSIHQRACFENLSAFTKWLEARYEVTVDFEKTALTEEKWSSFLAYGKVQLEVERPSVTSVDFMGTDGVSYVLVCSDMEFHVEKKVVHSRSAEILPAAMKTVDAGELHPAVMAWGEVAGHIKVLREANLSVEQGYVLERAEKEAYEVLSLLADMKRIDPDADGGKIMEVIEGIRRDVEKVRDDVLCELNAKVDASSMLVKSRERSGSSVLTLS